MESISQTVKAHRDFFRTGKTLDIEYRKDSLKKMKSVIEKYESKVFDAFWEDLRKSQFEAFGTEIGMVYKEIKHHVKKVKKWAKPTRVLTDIINFYSTSRIYHEPFGVVLIMSPWNYPFQLALTPLIGAISAGNCAVMKPAPYSKNISDVLVEIITESFDPGHVSVFAGGRDVNQALLEERYDYIFFTGGPRLGQIVMEKAAKHLTPLTLELGGKSPCIVESDANLKVAAQRITFGRYINSGQTCVAPDHLFAHKAIKDQLIKEISQCITNAYGEDPEQSPDFGRIITDQQFDRLEYLLNSAGKIVHGGRTNKEARYIEPTIIDEIKLEDPIMQEEIFGPLLPVLEYTSLDDVIESINDREKPLAMYFFSASNSAKEKLLARTSSGGGCINDTVMHLSNPRMPFGGVGNSGMGAYHGKHTFDTFSHHRSILHKTTKFNPTMAYAPYGNKLKYTKRFMQ
jgi:aldehyde dehydrogenase (NAD+)